MNITSGKIGDYLATKAGPVNANISTARTGPYHSVAGARQFAGVLTAPSVTEGTELTVTLLQATDASGAGSKVLKTISVTRAAGSPPDTISDSIVVDALDTDLDQAGATPFTFVAVQVQADAAIAGAGVLLLGGQRYRPE